MENYIQIFLYFVFTVDALLIIVNSWCAYVNAASLIKDKEDHDRPFRAIFLLLCLFFLHANMEALQRHIATFILSDVYKIDSDSVQSLLSDRGGMLGTALCALLLTLKWSPKWFVKMLD